ncbi:MAG: succinylglutamate desuccinylase/aspartoacylase family protein [Bacteroidota bacterium]
MDEPFEIDGTQIEPGQTKKISIKVARLHSGTGINLDLKVYRSKNPGPTMLVLGGVHGDEINGVEIVRKAITSKFFENLNCGSVIVIPLLNIYGFINFSREVPDGKDVNRSFPGNQKGSLASRVAWILFKKILPLVDFGIDFHTGGASRYNYPQVRYNIGDEASKQLAEAFAPPVLICNKPISKSLRAEARKIDVPVIIYEGGEALRFNGFAIQEGLNGLLRVMKTHNMIDEAPPQHLGTLEFSKSTWQRAARSGIFVWEISSGSYVKKGDLLGKIFEPHGKDSLRVTSRKSAYIIGHNNAPVVSQGDALFHFAFNDGFSLPEIYTELEPDSQD